MTMTNTTDQTNSITKVNRSQSHGRGLWGNKRVVVGIRVDEELYKAFKPVAERVFGSVCNPLEAFMAAILTCQKAAVNFGNTVSIERVVIERNLRERRKVEFERGEGVEGLFADFYVLDGGGLWLRKRVESDWDVNVNGHYVGCQCNLCRKLKAGDERG